MTTPPKATRFHIRPQERPPVPPAPDEAGIFDNHDDGFGAMDFRRPGDAPAADRPGVTVTKVPRIAGDEAIAAALAAIAAEGLTQRQLRRARLVAAKAGLVAASDLDAVRQLRLAGIDPFSRGSLLDMVSSRLGGAGGAAAAPEDPPPGRELSRLPGDVVQLPQTARPLALPSTEERAEVNQASEILRMQQDIARRRRRRLILLAARLTAFVLLPTLLAGWYFFRLATPMFATRAEFVIQQAAPTAAAGQLGGLLSGTALATSQDSIAVQGYLQSREAMARLEEDLGFRAHFQSPAIDPVQRLDPGASLEAAYKVYRRFVKISYDPTEGIVRMEVIAADPAVASAWADQLIRYAEQQVDHLTQRLRADQMTEAQTGYDEAQAALAASQRKLVELQERFKVISSESEVGLMTAQISSLETQLTTERLSLAQMQANETPNEARMEPVKRRIATLEAEIAAVRTRMTESTAESSSMAQVQGELLVAQADLQTRQMILATALQSMETARVEANRQVRYLSLSVRPIPPDAPTYPRAFENTAVTLLIMLGIYLMVSMTAAILREQVSA
ncbi:capsule biosynthesis protein [Tabrizicola sp.]|uniref:capsule biosynthesis protein n=1 Tax=Tabrizicola sp. TaxID=2005166 RepID=UPI0035AD9CA4